MQSFGPSLVKIKSMATGRYLSMKRDGTLKATVCDASQHFYEHSNINSFFLFILHTSLMSVYASFMRV